MRSLAVTTMSFMFYDYYVAKGIGIIKIVSEGDPDMAPGSKCNNRGCWSIKSNSM